MAAFDTLTLTIQRQIFTRSNIHFTPTVINNKDLSTLKVLRTLGVSLFDPVIIQGNTHLYTVSFSNPLPLSFF